MEPVLAAMFPPECVRGKASRFPLTTPPHRWRIHDPMLALRTCIPRLLALLAIFTLLPRWSTAEGAHQLRLVHYMPWFTSKPVSGQWGWHWTMDHYDPERFRWEGQREIAARDYPLIGPYDSGDPHALECQALLMKFGGLDGVVIDWYGTRDRFDYAANHAHTQQFIPWLKKAGLKFAICYEDQAIAPDEGVRRAQTDLAWAEAHWFSDSAYVRQEGRPLLLVFGPQRLAAADWTSLRTALKSQPLIFGLSHLSKSHGLDGFFAWPPVEGGKTLTPTQWQTTLEGYTARHTAGERLIATAFPGFQDSYAAAGVHPSYGSIAPRKGATLSESLDVAQRSRAPILQVATWNDYGEGTEVEPTRDQGYRYLEMIQRTGAARGFDAADLRLPVALYQLRKRAAHYPELTRELDRAADLLFASKCAEASAILDTTSVALAKKPAAFAEIPAEEDDAYHLLTDVLYREGKDLPADIRLRCRLDLYFPAKSDPKRPFPTVVWFHGGGLTAGERSIPLALRHRGIAVAAVDYRLAPGVKSPTYIEDAAAAVAWVSKHVSEYGGTPGRLFVSGHSAGAYLTLMLGLDRRWLAAQGLDANHLTGLIPLSPQVITHFAIRDERGIDEKQPIIDALAPLYHVRKDAPPMLIVTGDREKEMMGRYEENAYFWRMLKLVGNPDVTLHEIEGFDHGRMPEPAFPLLLQFVQKHIPK